METEIRSYWMYYCHKKSVIEQYTKEGLKGLQEKEVREMHDYLNYLWQKIDYYNHIIERQLLCIMLEHFIELKDDYKCTRIATLLTKHYPTSLDCQMQEWIEEEQFEKCEILKNLIEKTK